MYAITPKGVGEPVGFRKVRPGWELKEGETFFTSTNPEGLVLGPDEASLIAEPASRKLQEHKKELVEQVRRRRDFMVEQALTVELNGNEFSANERSQGHLSAAVLGAMLNPENRFTWHTTSFAAVELTSTEITELAELAYDEAQKWWDAAGQGVRAINAAATEAEATQAFQDIQWPT